MLILSPHRIHACSMQLPRQPVSRVQDAPQTVSAHKEKEQYGAESHAAMVSHVASDRRTVSQFEGPRRDSPANHGCRPVPAVITSGPGRWFGFALTQVTDSVWRGLAELEGPAGANRGVTLQGAGRDPHPRGCSSVPVHAASTAETLASGVRSGGFLQHLGRQ